MEVETVCQVPIREPVPSPAQTGSQQLAASGKDTPVKSRVGTKEKKKGSEAD